MLDFTVTLLANFADCIIIVMIVSLNYSPFFFFFFQLTLQLIQHFAFTSLMASQSLNLILTLPIFFPRPFHILSPALFSPLIKLFFQTISSGIDLVWNKTKDRYCMAMLHIKGLIDANMLVKTSEMIYKLEKKSNKDKSKAYLLMALSRGSLLPPSRTMPTLQKKCCYHLCPCYCTWGEMGLFLSPSHCWGNVSQEKEDGVKGFLPWRCALQDNNIG